ncbi:hypothetical protein M513_09769 [Trichuris suis]|uniref:Uncharacterized protein n=1 Tax=Trichuris suis TaxID=68888 RepID=A0A085LWH6_9BILA|nr:hypothetical protein M513_09769 [Trichuris suis]
MIQATLPSKAETDCAPRWMKVRKIPTANTSKQTKGLRPAETPGQRESIIRVNLAAAKGYCGLSIASHVLT